MSEVRNVLVLYLNFFFVFILYFVVEQGVGILWGVRKYKLVSVFF